MRTGNSLRVIALALLLSGGFACGDATGPADAAFKRDTPSVVPPAILSATGGELVPCVPEPTQVDTFSVTSHGGKFRIGYAELRIPKGAVLPGVTRRFEMQTPSAAFHSVLFTPVDGLGTVVFLAPVRLSLKYKGCDGKSGRRKVMVYVTDTVDPVTGLPRVLSLVGRLDDLLTMAVEGKTSHFSRYAVSY